MFELVKNNALKMTYKGKEDMLISHACRMDSEASRVSGKDEKIGVFLEEQLIHSMLNRDQVASKHAIGGFEFSFELECSFPRSPSSCPLRGCNGDTVNPIGLVRQDQF